MFFAVLQMAALSGIGIILFLISTGFLIYQTGVEIDFVNNKYRFIHAFGPQYFGNWMDIPDLDYISVFGANIVSQVTSRSNITLTSSANEIQVNLIAENNQHIKLFQSVNLDDAFIFAKEVATRFKLNIYDATTNEPNWLD